MRHMDRLPCPDILARKQAEWQRKYEEKLATNPQARPDSNKYAHKDIRKQLWTMSHGKCFYCESLLTDTSKEVDHQVEVSVDPSQAYAWDNLCLACPNCNDKLPNDAIPVTAALDPCRDSDEEIRANITFEDEVIRAVPGSVKGLNTIQKYRLNTELLDSKRSKWLNRIAKVIINIQNNLIKEGRDRCTAEEMRRLQLFMQPDSPYSLMSTIYISKIKLLSYLCAH